MRLPLWLRRPRRYWRHCPLWAWWWERKVEPCRFCTGTENPDRHDPSCWLA